MMLHYYYYFFYDATIPIVILFFCHQKTPQYYSAVVVRGVALNWDPMMSRDARLSESYTSDRFFSSSLGLQKDSYSAD